MCDGCASTCEWICASFSAFLWCFCVFLNFCNDWPSLHRDFDAPNRWNCLNEEKRSSLWEFDGVNILLNIFLLLFLFRSFRSFRQFHISGRTKPLKFKQNTKYSKKKDQCFALTTCQSIVKGTFSLYKILIFLDASNSVVCRVSIIWNLSFSYLYSLLALLQSW